MRLVAFVYCFLLYMRGMMNNELMRVYSDVNVKLNSWNELRKRFFREEKLTRTCMSSPVYK